MVSVDLGALGENAAAEHLTAKGLTIIERNYRCKEGEIDLICKTKEYLVFVEVKTRTGFGLDPKIQMTQKKRRQVRKMAEVFLLAHPEQRLQPRFDFVGVSFEGSDSIRIEHLENAF